jgi:long-chain acyl-CoA synthetase
MRNSVQQKRPETKATPQKNTELGVWTILDLLQALARRERAPAVIAFDANGVRTWDSETLSDQARRLAHGMQQAGLGHGSAAALWAPNSPVWIVAALAVLAGGGMLVPIDDLATPEQLEAALKTSNPRFVLTTRVHLEASNALLRASDSIVILVDDHPQTTGDARSWRSWLHTPTSTLPNPMGDDPAMLCWTSGTTGSPKAFVLTHRNIATNVEALRRLALVGPQDRVLLPLPLHHAYPFVVGMLTPLTCGTAIVLPGATTGPSLMQALHEGNVTVLIGVPRLYAALKAAIAQRIDAHHRAVRIAWQAVLNFLIFLQRSTRVHPGRLLFTAVRHRVAPKLRLMVSGGARLDQDIEEHLEALGWTVLSGYGLAETASLFTGNRPDDRRAGSAGRPLADGEIRIARPEDDGRGEIELHGSSITKGYLNDPEANRTAFTGDGWFRTGDLGFIDRDGFLFVTGRLKEILVLGGGKKVSPEELERNYGDSPEIAEIAVLEDKGALVALVRPDAAKLYARGATNLRDGIRVILGEKAQHLPSFLRLSSFALTSRPLPRTRLGKYRRFLLPSLYHKALAGNPARVAEPLTTEDQALLRNPAAAAVWDILRQRFPDQPINLDSDLSLDLNLDSFGWMELAIILHERTGIMLSDEDLARIQTIRDLLRLSAQRGVGAGTEPIRATASTSDIDDWLAPPSALLTALGAALYAINSLIMRKLFRLQVAGIDKLPSSGPIVISPNHVSYLDVLVIAAALNWSRVQNTYWAGDAQRLFPHAVGRIFCRAVHLFPVDAMHPGAALETAGRVLQAGNILVWFPEGWRSPDGQIQRFLPGIGQLLLRSGAPAVPTYIGGTFAALPRGQRLPRFRALSITFGEAAEATSLGSSGHGATNEERVADGLRQRLTALARRSVEETIWVRRD